VPVPLTSLKEGESGIIVNIKTNPKGRRGWGFQKRLTDMGLTPGTKITVVKSAPFRGPNSLGWKCQCRKVGDIQSANWLTSAYRELAGEDC